MHPHMGLRHVSNLDCARERILRQKNRLVDRVHSVRSTKGDGNAKERRATRSADGSYAGMGGGRRKTEALECALEDVLGRGTRVLRDCEFTKNSVLSLP